MARIQKPSIFISHNESDKKIALQIANFIKDESGKGYSVFMSSDPKFKGVRMGEDISVELREAIANCDVFLLLYTRKDVDWSWCMWEWGIASHPSSEKSTMIVLQCGSDAPKINAARRRVDVRVREDVLEFVKQYLTDKQMFRHGKAVAGHLADDVIEAKANALFERLSPLVKDIDPPVERSTWPYLQIAVPLETFEKISSEATPLDTDAQIKLIKESARVSVAGGKALNIFGRLGLTQNILLSKLARSVSGATGRKETPLLDCFCRQIAEASADKIPSIEAISVRGPEQEMEFVPVVTKVQIVGYLKTVFFDLYFLSLPKAPFKSVASEMLPKSDFYWKPLDKHLEHYKLVALSESMKTQEKNRLPVLDEKDVARYVIPRAAIDEFIVENRLRAEELTVADLLTNEHMRTTFEQSFAFVGVDDTMENARAKISGNVRDVFVTQTGLPQEPVRGLLTEVDLAQEVQGRDTKRGVSLSTPVTSDQVRVAGA
jgi:TIR domain-containing protein